MPWKIPWQQKKPAGSDQAGSFYSLLRTVIGEVRRQGEPPVRDAESFSRYICDLCHSASPVSSLRQCVICGRWACPDCWKDEFYVCSSCNGIIRLHQMQCPGSGQQGVKPEAPSEEETKAEQSE